MSKGFLTRVAVVATFAAAGLVLSVAPAQAAYADCPSGSACLWRGESYPGQPDGRFTLKMDHVTVGINSIVNNGNTSVARFYNKRSYQGASIYLNNPARGGQWRDPRLSNGTDAQPGDWASKILSAQFV